MILQIYKRLQNRGLLLIQEPIAETVEPLEKNAILPHDFGGNVSKVKGLKHYKTSSHKDLKTILLNFPGKFESYRTLHSQEENPHLLSWNLQKTEEHLNFLQENHPKEIILIKRGIQILKKLSRGVLNMPRALIAVRKAES